MPIAPAKSVWFMKVFPSDAGISWLDSSCTGYGSAP